MSVMADIHRNYHLDGDNDYSLSARVDHFLSKQTLMPSDLVSRGIDIANPERPPFTLKKDLLDEATEVISGLQSVLDASYALLGTKEGSPYTVDPRGMMLKTLQGSASFFDLERAYDVILGRVSRAQKVFMWYIEVYQEQATLQSPTATDPAVYESLQEEGVGLDSVFNMLYGKVPSLNRRLDETARTRLGAGEPLRSILLSPVHLKSVFSPRQPEENPLEHYYNESGGKIIDGPHRPMSVAPREVPIQQLEGRHARIASPPVAPLASGSVARREDSVSSLRATQERLGSESSALEDTGYYSADSGLHGTEATARGAMDRGLVFGSASAARPTWNRSREPWGGSSRQSIGLSEALPFRPAFPRPSATEPPAIDSGRDTPPHLSRAPSGRPGGAPPDPPDPPDPNNGGLGGNGGNGGWGRNPPPPRGPAAGQPPAFPGYMPSGGGPPYGGGGGGGGTPHGGGGPPPSGGGPHGNQNNYQPPYYPRYEQGPSIKQEIKPEQLPTWDGGYDTAIQYFHDLQEVAALGGSIPECMGFWLWKTLKKDTPVAKWYAALSTDLKAWMRGHYLNYVEVLQHYFLGRDWQQYIELEYQQQLFRQPGHEKESPHDFIMRRILYTRMLLQVVPDSEQEVYYICKKNPNAWESLLVRDNIPNTATLQLRVREIGPALTDAWTKSRGIVVTQENLFSMLQKAGIKLSTSSSKPPYRPYRQGISSISATAHDAEVVVEGSLEDESGELEPDPLPPDEAIIHQAFISMRREPPPSRRGPFPFSRRDEVNTSMPKLPAWPCKACGSKNHWDRECPHWDVYREKVKHAKWVEKEDSTEESSVYSQVYQALKTQVISSAYIKEGEYLKLSLKVHARAIETEDQRVRETASAMHPRSYCEEVEDEDVLAAKNKKKCESEALFESEDDPIRLDQRQANASFRQEETDFPPPPKESEIFVVPRRKKALPGQAALGVSVLSMKGRAGSLEDEVVDLRLDSCADVSLVSSEFVRKLKHKLPIRQGMKMRLWQLTDRNATLEGYVNLPLFVESEEGTVIQTEVEAYVVPGMSVDILLGEDYQLAFEMTTSRHVEKGTTVSYRHCPHKIRAEAVGRTEDFAKVAPTHVSNASYVKAKAHRREQSRRFRKRKRFGEEKRTIRAAQDTLIQPKSVASIRVEGYFEDERDWLVEKSLIANADDSFFAVPNVFFSSLNPIIPIMNPSETPRFVRKGEVVGTIVDPENFLDAPKSFEQWHEMEARALSVASLVSSLQELEMLAEEAKEAKSSTVQDPSKERKGDEESAPVERNKTAALLAGNSEEEEVDRESWGPKTAEMPDPRNYPSEEMEKLLDVGSLPEELKDQAWEMLRRRVKAFAFDGRLGSHPSRVHIRTVDGQVPISVPMYASSPAKKLVIEEQLKKWFELGVIEPSKSPWSAPVVIAYRNGKPRFCVDY
ncbi:hypothetical protein HWV62_29370 [Athelia sp. TMB]|nr:hypothetical protein HWV62_29370 [Athelia sp. TMB]